MKTYFTIFCITFLLISCESKVDNSANETFEKNSKTVMTYLEGYQNESLDYSELFADDFVMNDTHYGVATDSLSLSDVIANDKDSWANADFKIISEINLLPGVNAETKLADGSVRYYGDWEITIPANDSIPAKSGVLRLYESFDFNEEGKIIFQQYYGDFGGLQNHFKSK